MTGAEVIRASLTESSEGHLGLGGYRPSKTGVAFSTKARAAFRWSCVLPLAIMFSASRWSVSAKVLVAPKLKLSLIRPKARVGPAARRSASAIVSSIRES